ncbi:MAG: arginine--tRNA ligase [Intestinibacter bartlettii]|uniref:arginine--tRNA ligase n=1 Tax=Intestinibacter bartlettii TaxID=261299 RepID=UPI0026EEC75D|nr:arginine--tRNA ligase [Intestinibacter bartlettii]MDO5009745.1 arginine--tRNA ligase [Intestinibacter bartlettii]
MQDFKLAIANCLKEKIEDLTLEEIVALIEVPPNKEMGDFAFPCFKLAKVFRKAPNMIAADLAENIEAKGAISKVMPLGGYVNFFVNKSQLAQTVINDVLTKKEKYGHTDLGQDKAVVIDFSSPNIAKPFHIGHIRTTVIGNALYKIYDSQGYNVVRVNHLGDYGTQFGKLIVAFKLWGRKEAVEANPIPELLKLYVKFHEEAEEKPEMEDEARAWFTKLENGDEEAKALWQWFRDESLKEFARVYDLLDIEFDSYAGESFYSDKMDVVIEQLKEKGLLVQSQGTNVVDLEEYNMPPALITKNDGSTLYMTRDLAAAIYRKNTYDFDKCIYVVGSQQSLHFQQLFKVLELMGYEWAKDLIHVPFGMVALEEGTMSTRKGRVVFLEDVLKQAVEKTKEIVLSKNPNAKNVEQIAKQVGVGAVVFQELSNSRIKDYTFSWSRTLSFEGETGPYVQYTHARCCAVLRKAEEEVTKDINYDLLSEGDGAEVLKVIGSFNKSILAAMRKNEPHIITRFVLDLAQAFNKFYHDNPILVEDAELRKARLALVAATRQTIENALALLGMHAPERM